MGLLLEAVDADGERRWRWILRDSNEGQIVAGHKVALDQESDELTGRGHPVPGDGGAHDRVQRGVLHETAGRG